MSELLSIRERIDDSAAMIASLEKDLVAFPQEESIRWNLKSIEKRKRQLESEFADLSALMGMDLCRYHFIPEGEPIRVSAMAGAIVEYQHLFSLVVEALQSGPKQSAKVSHSAAEATAFDYGYSFAASVGFAFTVRNSRLIGMKSTFDQAFDAIADLVKSERPESIRKHARTLGRGPIRVLYEWAIAHKRSRLSAKIEWTRGARPQGAFVVQKAEFQALAEVIDRTSDQEVEEFSAAGTLFGVDTRAKTFKFALDDGRTIKGDLAQTVDPTNTVEVPKRYQASFRRTSSVLYSTDEAKESFQLIALAAAPALE